MAPTFKEWHAIVEALGAGEQILILRKGGIAEGRGGFQLEAQRFWLFPTRFHAQSEKTKPAAAKWFSATAPVEEPTVYLRYFADVVQSVFLNDWASVARLDPFHLWTESTVRERFEWSKPSGIHALVVRVHRLENAVPVDLTPEMGGCKSWITLSVPFDVRPSKPVLDNATFAHRVGEIGFEPAR